MDVRRHTWRREEGRVIELPNSSLWPSIKYDCVSLETKINTGEAALSCKSHTLATGSHLFSSARHLFEDTRAALERRQIQWSGQGWWDALCLTSDISAARRPCCSAEASIGMTGGPCDGRDASKHVMTWSHWKEAQTNSYTCALTADHTTLLRRWINVVDVDSTSQQRRVPSGLPRMWCGCHTAWRRLRKPLNWKTNLETILAAVYISVNRRCRLWHQHVYNLYYSFMMYRVMHISYATNDTLWTTVYSNVYYIIITMNLKL